jgi:pSer/pThr/pTyr-binding forkhead associated (FHA) protein
MPEYSFMITDGPDLGRSFTLEEGITLVGRGDGRLPGDPPNSRRWTLIDKTVSRTHAQITLSEPGAPQLTHMSQTNDTYVDGRKIEQETLQPGQTVRMGQTTMEVQMESGWARKAR